MRCQLDEHISFRIRWFGEQCRKNANTCLCTYTLHANIYTHAQYKYIGTRVHVRVKTVSRARTSLAPYNILQFQCIYIYIYIGLLNGVLYLLPLYLFEVYEGPSHLFTTHTRSPPLPPNVINSFFIPFLLLLLLLLQLLQQSSRTINPTD